MFEFNGELYDNEIDFLDALRKEYEVGDQQVVLDALEEYGFDVNDLKVV